MGKRFSSPPLSKHTQKSEVHLLTPAPPPLPLSAALCNTAIWFGVWIPVHAGAGLHSSRGGPQYFSPQFQRFKVGLNTSCFSTTRELSQIYDFTALQSRADSVLLTVTCAECVLLDSSSNIVNNRRAEKKMDT